MKERMQHHGLTGEMSLSVKCQANLATNRRRRVTFTSRRQMRKERDEETGDWRKTSCFELDEKTHRWQRDDQR